MAKKKTINTVKRQKNLKKTTKLPFRRTQLFILLFAVVGAAIIMKSFAGSAKITLATGPLTQTSEKVWNSPNPDAPKSCMNEDDYHFREWSGTLNGTFTATERLCDANIDISNGQYWGPGGVGIQAQILAVGTLNDLSITSPQGDVHHAVLVGSTTYGNGKSAKTANLYQVCYVPSYTLANNIGGQSLPGGNWTISVTGNLSTVLYKGNFSVTSSMADVYFQQRSCPPSQQNLI
jgi:hypothetical protein